MSVTDCKNTARVIGEFASQSLKDERNQNPESINKAYGQNLVSQEKKIPKPYGKGCRQWEV